MKRNLADLAAHELGHAVAIAHGTAGVNTVYIERQEGCIVAHTDDVPHAEVFSSVDGIVRIISSGIVTELLREYRNGEIEPALMVAGLFDMSFNRCFSETAFGGADAETLRIIFTRRDHRTFSPSIYKLGKLLWTHFVSVADEAALEKTGRRIQALKIGQRITFDVKGLLQAAGIDIAKAA